jgi:hypothetical protein
VISVLDAVRMTLDMMKNRYEDVLIGFCWDNESGGEEEGICCLLVGRVFAAGVFFVVWQVWVESLSKQSHYTAINLVSLHFLLANGIASLLLISSAS